MIRPLIAFSSLVLPCLLLLHCVGANGATSPTSATVVIQAASDRLIQTSRLQCLQGSPGRDGIRGDPGVPGFNGRNGLPGASGRKGDKGDCDDHRGEKGLKGDEGGNGPQGISGSEGPPGPPGASGDVEAQYGTSIINWNQCSFNNMNDGRDHGVIRECMFYKLSDATSLRLTWSGDIRLHGCTSCCMRWYFTVNGLECDSTVDGQVYQAQNLNIHRISTISGYCRHVGGLPLLEGQYRIQFNVGNCPFTTNLYDAYTGHHSNSRIIIEEIAPARPPPSLALPQPPTYIYQPNWRQCTWNAKNDGRDYGDFGHCSFNKQRDDTWLKISYNGGIRVIQHDSGRWFFRIDGAECTVPDSIDARLYQSINFNNPRPAAITGFCQSAGGSRIRKGMHNIILSIDRVGGRDLYTCWNSVCRIVIEEVPPPANAFPDAGNTCGGTGSGASCVFPFTYKGKSYSQCTTAERKQSWCATQRGDVGSHNKWGYCICNKKVGGNNTAYMPEWEQYTWKSLSSGIDNGIVREVIFIKESGKTSLRISWHGAIRIQGCTNCCRRWFFTIDGKECRSPQPIDGVVYQSNNIDLHRPATVGGICESALENGAYSIAAGTRRIQFRVGQCPGSGPVFDAYTGWSYVSRIVVEEMPAAKPVIPPNSIGFVPNYKQCAFNKLNNGEDQGVVIQCPFVKRETGSYLRLTYQGDIRLSGCNVCCMRWYFTVDGAECTVPSAIDAVIHITGNVNHHRPGTVTGLCGGVGGSRTLKQGSRNVQFRVGKCNGFGVFDAYTCWNSACRVIIEELPPPQ